MPIPPEQRLHRWLDRSGVIGAAATSQILAAENDERIALFIQNVSADGLWVNFNKVPAVQAAPSIRLDPGATLRMEAPNFVDTTTVTIIGPNPGAAFVAREF